MFVSFDYFLFFFFLPSLWIKLVYDLYTFPFTLFISFISRVSFPICFVSRVYWWWRTLMLQHSFLSSLFLVTPFYTSCKYHFASVTGAQIEVTNFSVIYFVPISLLINCNICFFSLFSSFIMLNFILFTLYYFFSFSLFISLWSLAYSEAHPEDYFHLELLVIMLKKDSYIWNERIWLG